MRHIQARVKRCDENQAIVGLMLGMVRSNRRLGFHNPQIYDHRDDKLIFFEI